MKNATFSIVMPAPMKAFVERRLEGGFGNASEYFRHLVREDQKRAAQEQLEAMLLAGEDSGPSRVIDDTWWDRKKSSLDAKNAPAKRSRKKARRS